MRFLLVALMLMFATPALADNPTKKFQPRQDVVKKLQNRWQEKAIGMGLASNGAVMEMFVSDDGSTWTILFTMPTGMSFILATGENWDTKSVLKGELY